ncbi:hexose kinase [Sporosarcina sp. Marseille-Q4063]|uniref:hexose kinase n=1 Tax=Sporosarcina sp. Marseille-Q4063 TaxID=2810514 RepID=UPI001BAEF210|nr:hexose kinase [Sporosarcina sp. Marseille-Q4063]QUW21531.1 hexose kinase [Sporosarcina sp. Marseille-Q4063]
MILTLTLNPAVDISYKLDRLELDVVNRVASVSKTAGGKGLNVARVLHQLGEEVAASGFLGGSLGSFISAELQVIGINDFFVPIQGETRNCIAILHEGKQTEILESGPIISEVEAGFFLGKFEEYIQQVDLVTISGSLPKGLSVDFYAKLIEISNRYETKVLLDTNGTLLTSTLNSTSKPYLIKPNEEEMAELLGKSTIDEVEIIGALESMLFTDIPWVVVTLGANGAIVKHNKTIYRAALPKVNAINPVGSGDSVVAGFAAGITRGLTDEELIKFGLTMGVLNALEDKTGYINIEKVETVSSQIEVKSTSIH